MEAIYLVQTREPMCGWQAHNKPLTAEKAAALFLALQPGLDECTEIRIITTSHDDN